MTPLTWFRIGVDGSRTLLLAALWLSATLAVLVASWSHAALRIPVTVGFSVVAAGLLALAAGARLAFLDLFGQLQYRGRFGLFVLHVATAFAPWVVTGHMTLATSLAAVVSLLCLQVQFRVTMGRIHGLSALVVLVSCASRPWPPAPLVLGWLGMFLTSVQLEAIHFRLQDDGEDVVLAGTDVLADWLRAIAIPMTVLSGAYAALAPTIWLNVRVLAFDRRTSQVIAGMPASSAEKLYWDTFILLIFLVAGVGVLYWLEGQLRSSSRGDTMEDLVGSGSVTSREIGEPRREAGLKEEKPVGARARILAAFRAFCAALSELGQGRRPSETAREFLGRVAPSVGTAGSFDRACYSRLAIEESDAAHVEVALAGEAERLRADAEPGPADGH